MLSISRFRLSQFTDSLRQPARQNFGQGVWRYRLGHVIVHARLDAALPVADQHGEMRRPGTAPTRRLLPDLRSRRNSAPREGATPHPRVGFRSPAPESPESRRTRKLTDSSGGLPAGREVHQCPADRKWLSFHWADDGGSVGPFYDKPVYLPSPGKHASGTPVVALRHAISCATPSSMKVWTRWRTTTISRRSGTAYGVDAPRLHLTGLARSRAVPLTQSRRPAANRVSVQRLRPPPLLWMDGLQNPIHLHRNTFGRFGNLLLIIRRFEVRMHF